MYFAITLDSWVAMFLTRAIGFTHCVASYHP